MPLIVEVQDASSGVARHGEGDHAGEDGGLAGGRDDVRGEKGRVPVGVVNPDPGAEVLGVPLGVGDVVSVGEQNMVDPAGVFDRPDERSFQCGASTRNGSRVWGTNQAWAPKERRSLCPQRKTPGATCIGKTPGGALRRLAVPTERVGQASAARHSVISSSGVDGWRVTTDCPSPVDVMRSGACWRATSHPVPAGIRRPQPYPRRNPGRRRLGTRQGPDRDPAPGRSGCWRRAHHAAPLLPRPRDTDRSDHQGLDPGDPAGRDRRGPRAGFAARGDAPGGRRDGRSRRPPAVRLRRSANGQGLPDARRGSTPRSRHRPHQARTSRRRVRPRSQRELDSARSLGPCLPRM